MSLRRCQNTQNVQRPENPHVHYGLWAIITCRFRVISCDVGTPLAREVGVGRLCACGDGVQRDSVLSAQFCCEPETALKNNVYLKRKQRRV